MICSTLTLSVALIIAPMAMQSVFVSVPASPKTR